MNQYSCLHLITCLLFLACTLLAACTSRYPNLAKPDELPFSPYGSNIQIKFKTGVADQNGELLAVTPQSLFIRLSSSNILEIPREVVREGVLRVATTSNDPGALIAWASVLPLTTILHGFFLIITLPVNLAVSIPVAVSAGTSTFKLDYPRQMTWEDLGKYARFPQGPPAEVLNRAVPQQPKENRK